MKRLLTITALALITVTTGVASAATLKPLAAESAWDSAPIFTTAPPNDPRLFVVERGDPATHVAQIRIFEDGALRPTPFLSISNVALNSERGLLSMAFAPDYATSGFFYVFWVANGPDALDPAGAVGDIRIVEFKRSAADPDVADPASARLVLKTSHSAGNHNGGWMAFGPDGELYFTIGDNATGGAAAKTLDNLFGKVMRIDPADPDGTGPETRTIPTDNPFLSNPSPAVRDEIYTYGLRNPFRASFTPNGNLAIADVGEVTTEEVDVGNLAGKNMGWPECEGFCDPPDPRFTDPFFTYEHDYDNANPAPLTGNVIIGGNVIRDPDLAGLTGRYIYGDNNRKDLRTLNLSVPGGDPVDPGLSVGQYSLLSFGEDSRGCTYVMADGTVYRIAANAGSTTACPHLNDPPDPPDPPIDSTRPKLRLSGGAQRLGKKLQFFATCSERCTLGSRGSVKAKRHGRKRSVGFRFTPGTSAAGGGVRVKIVLRLKPRPLKRARKVLRSGRRLRAVVVTRASDPSGNSRTVKRTIKIRRASR